MDRNKKFKDYLYPIYEKNIVILNIINWAIVFMFVTIIFYYLIQGISWDYNFKYSFYERLYLEKMESLKRYTDDIGTVSCKVCYALLLLMKTSIVICFIKFLLFFRILTDQQSLFPTKKKLKRALWKIVFGYFYRKKYYYIYRKNMNYFDFWGEAFKDEVTNKKDNIVENVEYTNSYLTYNNFKEWEDVYNIDDIVYYENNFVRPPKKLDWSIVNKDSNKIFNIYNRKKAYNKLPIFHMRSLYQILAWPRIIGFFMGIIFFALLAFSFCNIWVYKIFVINTTLIVKDGFVV
jgi:hypothetical protein